MKRLLQPCLAVAAALCLAGIPTLHAQEAPPAALANLAPDELVKNVTNDVLDIVRADKAIQAGDASRIDALVNQKVLPHFDFRRMTMLAVGRDWARATQNQQNRLTEAFRALLVRTYSNSLTQYHDQTIDFKPLRAAPTDTQVKVRTEVRQSGAQPIGIDYALEKTAQGWKVYDIAVSGVSLVTNYRGSFGDEIRAGGIDGLIRAIETKNRSLAAGQARR
jgi:phospholipid transport system substrate-binding protein